MSSEVRTTKAHMAQGKVQTGDGESCHETTKDARFWFTQIEMLPVCMLGYGMSKVRKNQATYPSSSEAQGQMYKMCRNFY